MDIFTRLKYIRILNKFLCNKCDGICIDEKLNKKTQIPNLRVYIEKNYLKTEFNKATIDYNWYK
jgi:hypothetical protein